MEIIFNYLFPFLNLLKLIKFKNAIIINYSYNSKITEHLLFAGETRQEQRRRPPLAGQVEAGAGV
jgi:hypothetical protein